MTYADIAAYLDAQGERLMAVMVRQQTTQLQECRTAAQKTLDEYYALRDRLEKRPRVAEVASGKPGPRSDD